MKLKKFAIFMVALFLCVALIGCKKKSYTVNFDADGGSSVASVTYNSKEGLTSLPTTTKENFKFDGWMDTEDNNKKISSIPVGAAKNYNLKASWTQVVFNITVDLDGGTAQGTVPTTYDSSKLTTLPSVTKEGFTFKGWSVNNSSTTVTSLAKNAYTGDITIKAVFGSGDAEERNIQFDADGGELTNAPSTYIVGVGLPQLPTPSKEGFAFAGWFTADGTQITSISKTDDQAFSLTAKWVLESERHSITYSLDGGKFEDGVAAQTYYFESVGLKLPTPVKDGFEFQGWLIGESETPVFEIPTGTTADVVCKAVWDIPSVAEYYTITYIYEGGSLPEGIKDKYLGGEGYVLPDAIPADENQKFLGWYDQLTQNKIEKIGKDYRRDITLVAKFGIPKVYQPLWELNQIGFDGNGMTYGIKVLPVSDYDPNDPDFSGSNEDILKEHQSLVESAYNIVIEWQKWDDSAPWGPERVKFINNSYITNSFAKTDTYVVTITSQWIPTLVKSDSIAELYNIETEEGIFTKLSYDATKQDSEGYIQDETVNEASSVQNRVYGYQTGPARPDYFMYYNVDKVKECNLEDPAELWLKGEWTLSKFDEWVTKAQNTLKTDTDSYALDMGFAESIIGFVAASGNKISQATPPILNLIQAKVTDSIQLLQNYYNSKVYYGRGVQDVSPGFQAGKTLLHHGDLWFLKNSDRFNPDKMKFTIGVVPYPCADGEGGTPILSNNAKDGIKINDSEYLMVDGQYVTGVDMSDSSFQVPFTGTSCYAVLNVSPTSSKNGISPEIIMNILHDLTSAVGPNPNNVVNLTEDESYRNLLMTKFDREIDVEVVMSCQGTTYFELMELLSMTVGGGSHFGTDAFWPLAAEIIKSKDSPTTKLREVIDKYKKAMRELGYNVQ